MTPHEFKAKWSTPSGNERQTYLSHFNDLCDMLGVEKPSAHDRAVWHAYGWYDDATMTTEAELLSRLLALNEGRTHGAH